MPARASLIIERFGDSPQVGGDHAAVRFFAIRAACRVWQNSKGPCLQRSLALYHELIRAGASPSLVCGIAHEQTRIVGHAWVEIEGSPVIEEAQTFADYERVIVYSTSGSRYP